MRSKSTIRLPRSWIELSVCYLLLTIASFLISIISADGISRERVTLSSHPNQIQESESLAPVTPDRRPSTLPHPDRGLLDLPKLTELRALHPQAKPTTLARIDAPATFLTFVGPPKEGKERRIISDSIRDD